MKLIRTALIGVVAIIAAGATVWFVPALHVRAIVWGLNSGFIAVETADWSYLRLRSGDEGLTGLRYLKRHGRTDEIKITAAGVSQVQTEELDSNEPVVPSNGTINLKNLPYVFDATATNIEVQPPAKVPAGFANDTRFDLWFCDPKHEVTSCRFRLADLNGDGRSEMIHEWPYNWHIFEDTAEGWKETHTMSVCHENAADMSARHYSLVKSKFDDLSINGHIVRLLDTECGALAWRWDHLPSSSGGRTMTPEEAKAYAMDSAKAMRRQTQNLSRMRILSPAGAAIPASLAADIEQETLIVDPLSGSKTGYEHKSEFRGEVMFVPLVPAYNNPPPCFQNHDLSQCVGVLQDLDRDGQPELIVIDLEITGESTDYHRVTLLRFDGRHWHLGGSGAICAEWGELKTARFAAVASDWPSIAVGDGLYSIMNESDRCVARRSTPVILN